MKPITLDLEKLSSKNPGIKYGFAKELLKIGANSPRVLYPHLDYWTKMMGSDNNILKWTAIDIIGYVSAVDKENKTDKLIKNLLLFLHGGHLITCNHAIFAMGLLAQNKPERRNSIIKELLSISKDTFDTEECKNIATGKVLETLRSFLDDIRNNKDAIDFIERAKNNTRNATKKKADLLSKKIAVLNSHKN
jgi:hypothetical protein